jgi:hypothetical protein
MSGPLQNEDNKAISILFRVYASYVQEGRTTASLPYPVAVREELPAVTAEIFTRLAGGAAALKADPDLGSIARVLEKMPEPDRQDPDKIAAAVKPLLAKAP